ncbi:MAG: DUF3987 domain-containing protein [Bacteroidales bacterium]|nr:DUF3987 domain-containing protein [Bacteroidales bacterium]
MTTKKFNIQDWLPAEEDNSPAKTQQPNDAIDDLEIITQRIESAHTDIAPTYQQWCELGFALSDHLGENGRTYYHRLSRFYHNYTEKETDQQYDRCMRAKGTGVTIKTFFQLAKEAGISLGTIRATPEIKSPISSKLPISPTGNIGNIENFEKTPTFSSAIKNSLPYLLDSIAKLSNNEEDCDLLLLGSLVVISACLPNVSGIYGGREVYPNLFLFLTAQASAGKGRLTLCRHLVQPIHKEQRNIYESEMLVYKSKLQEYNAAGKKKAMMEKPEEPPQRMLFIPANSSATSVYQILNDNRGIGLMFETEGDTLSTTFASDYGNYSDGFRKAFHHEQISYTRRKDHEYVELALPKLSVLLSGTPRQILTLIPDAENGLFSRFIFYYMNVKLEWMDMFATPSGVTLDEQFATLGEEFYNLYKLLADSPKIRFTLTKDQQKKFTSYFESAQSEYHSLFGADIIASIRRLGLITFRIAMILTTLRLMEYGDTKETITCEDTDFNTALHMSQILLQHTARVFDFFPDKNANIETQLTLKDKFLESLPKEFDRATYLQHALSLDIPERTADRQIKSFCAKGQIAKLQHGKYTKN